jgi:predicted DCC family thiol-disulfide oxidoreductase YuxK
LGQAIEILFIYGAISVNTEMTDKMNKRRHNWVCYDADCALCVRWAGRFRSLLARNGFELIPLQSPAVREVLEVPENELLAEMRVITSGGSVFGGADALVYLSHVVCKPLFALTRIPGVKPLLRIIYRFLARHRACSVTCEHLPPKRTGETPLPLSLQWGTRPIGYYPINIVFIYLPIVYAWAAWKGRR